LGFELKTKRKSIEESFELKEKRKQKEKSSKESFELKEKRK